MAQAYSNKAGLEELANIEKMFNQAQRGGDTTYNGQKLATYEETVSTLQGLIDKLKTDNTTDGKFIRKTLENRMVFLQYTENFKGQRNDSAKRDARDIAMAANVRWLTDEIFPDKKLIIVGHNYHNARSNPDQTVMGEILAQAYGDQYFSIGVFADSGAIRDNRNDVKRMVTADSSANDLKWVIKSLLPGINYISLDSKTVEKLPWLGSELVINDTFINSLEGNTMVLTEQFDALITLDKISPSNHVRAKDKERSKSVGPKKGLKRASDKKRKPRSGEKN
jgi:erythromycin esterase